MHSLNLHEFLDIFVTLGNHESATMNQMYGFDGEVKAKYSVQMAELFTEVYNWLPLAHCLNHRVLVSIFQNCYIVCMFLYIFMVYHLVSLLPYSLTPDFQLADQL